MLFNRGVFMQVVTTIIVFTVLGVAIWFAFLLVRAFWRAVTQPVSRPSSQGGSQSASGQSSNSLEMSAEEEGNVHSGPYGYSPNTAYPETQYGSLFNPDAEWNHEEQ